VVQNDLPPLHTEFPKTRELDKAKIPETLFAKKNSKLIKPLYFKIQLLTPIKTPSLTDNLTFCDIVIS
jgi:hypothetical protein